MTNPAQKLFRHLNKKATSEDVQNIERYTKQRPSHILSNGCEMSEVVNKCLDKEDELTFGVAFDEFEES